MTILLYEYPSVCEVQCFVSNVLAMVHLNCKNCKKQFHVEGELELSYLNLHSIYFIHGVNCKLDVSNHFWICYK